MPRQNRVTPFGELIATPARGTLMGNRGCLHDATGRIRRPYAGRRWIICLLAFKNRHRPVMAPGRYTELFFLDEATALAAGHRPCAECQRGRYLEFLDHWGAANGRARAGLSADDVDRVLHDERLASARDRRMFSERVSRLPAGTMVADAAGGALLVLADGVRAWTPEGYAGASAPSRDAMTVLTPRSIVRALAHGYPLTVHASASR